MRFDEFLECNAISFSVVNELDGYLVEVAVPTEWVAVQSSLVPSAWVCVVMARVIAADSHTLIAQLTFTSLLESPVHRSQIGFGVFPSSWASPTQPSFPGAPAPGPTEVH